MTDAQIAAAAGEHFVAYKIATLGFVPALVRQRVPGIDLLVSSADGARTIGVHVKSASSAVREKDRLEQQNAFHLRFPLGQRVLTGIGEKTVFCFVDLRRTNPEDGPHVYVIPANELKKEYDGVRIRKYAQFHHHRPMSEMEKYRNNWQPVIEALSVEKVGQRSTRATPVIPRRALPQPFRKTILVVDDMGSAREMLRDVLTLRGCEVLLAPNGATALDVAATHSIDACLIDLEMPGMNGIELTEALRHQNGRLGRDAQIWIMTGSYRSDILQPALAAGASAVLLKPLDIEEVCRCLNGEGAVVGRVFGREALPVSR